jgi:hypothetical protein
MRRLDEIEFVPIYRTSHVAVMPLAATNIGGSPHECDWGLFDHAFLEGLRLTRKLRSFGFPDCRNNPARNRSCARVR